MGVLKKIQQATCNHGFTRGGVCQYCDREGLHQKLKTPEHISERNNSKGGLTIKKVPLRGVKEVKKNKK